uniref:Uncharacterized protein n=1 Tax=Arundo donax TaxID=35708 RepID=A0A0A9B0A4_ARUDO
MEGAHLYGAHLGSALDGSPTSRLAVGAAYTAITIRPQQR